MIENTQKKPLEQISDFIAQGKLDEAIKGLSQLLKHTKHLDEILIQSARHNSIKKQIRTGTVNFENAEVTKNKITFALIELVNEIEEEMTSNPTVRKEMTEYEKVFKQTVYIKDSGAIALNGDINIQGEYVAGRDMVIGEQPEKRKSFFGRLFGK